MKLTLTKHWQVLKADPAGPPPSETFGLVHVGTPPADESQWWGPDVMIVNGARVHRAADAVSQLFLGFADTAPNFRKRSPIIDQLFRSIRF